MGSKGKYLHSSFRRHKNNITALTSKLAVEGKWSNQKMSIQKKAKTERKGNIDLPEQIQSII